MITTQNPVSLIPPERASTGSIKDFANRIRRGTLDLSDPAQKAALADALTMVQNQLDTILVALRGPLPINEPLQVLDQEGTLLAQLGQMIDPSDRGLYWPLWVKYFYLGGDGPATGTRVELPASGWSTPTGSFSRASFDPSTVTLEELAQRVAALIRDLMDAGILTT